VSDRPGHDGGQRYPLRNSNIDRITGHRLLPGGSRSIRNHREATYRGIRRTHLQFITGQLSQRISEGVPSIGGLVGRRPTLHFIPISTPFPLLDQISGVSHLVDDPIDTAFRDVEFGRDIAKPGFRIISDAEEHPPVVGK
jgi:hypothetical protein